MNKEILVDASGYSTRVAVVEDGSPVELYVEQEGTERLVGNIYNGKVQNVLPGMQAAFVDIGLERNAFLYAGDIVPFNDLARDLDLSITPVREALQRLNEEGLVAQRQVLEYINQYLAEFNADRGYQYILARQFPGPILYGDSTLDVTNDVIAGLNAKYNAEKAKK